MRSSLPAVLVSVIIRGAILAGEPAPPASNAAEVLFTIGKPDGSPRGFGGDPQEPESILQQFPDPVRFVAGRDSPSAWPRIHPGTMDGWAGGRAHPYSIFFRVETVPAAPLYLVIGLATFHPSPSVLTVVLNGTEIAARRLPSGKDVDDPTQEGPTASLEFPIPAGTVRSGENALSITLGDGSWIVYDYLRLGTERQPPRLIREAVLSLDRLRAGPMAGAEEFIFCARRENEADWHWYANLGYYADDAGRKAWREGARLYRWNSRTGALAVLLDDPRGGIRDPQVRHDGKRILFSYRRGGTENHLLHEIGIDGSGLRRLTDGDYDDIEPTYLPDGDLAFVSTRCKRWVNCWFTQVAVLHRSDGDGRNIRALSSNSEQDNTPWPLPDGRLLYTRWEYVDRSQVDYHHLWTVNPDGSGPMVLYGNLQPGTVMIDAKPIPGSDKVVAVFSPGHGDREHVGSITIVDPRAGPDERASARRIGRGRKLRDPWAFSEDCCMAAGGPALFVMDGAGNQEEIFRLPAADVEAGLTLHEPRPLVTRALERVIPESLDPGAATGRMVLADIYDGRNMEGVRRGEIEKLLVLETLPKPINYSGSMEPISYGGTFTLERILGTVPVEPDGSAHFELPALRSLFFVALDGKGRAVKRMQSFVTVQPGSSSGCIGCHEPRTRAPRSPAGPGAYLAMKRPPSRIEAIRGVPEVIDFPRDIQPIIDALCAGCHGYEKTPAGGPRDGGVILTGDRGPIYSHGYYAMSVARLFSDGRNEARSNYPPRGLGSADSRLLDMLDGSHHGVQADALQKDILRLWIETGAAYTGTYASLGSGMIGGYLEERQVGMDSDWPEAAAAAAVIARRCAPCHDRPENRLPANLSDEGGVTLWQPGLREASPRNSRHILYNLSRPEKSIILLAPLAEGAGGWGLCRDPGTRKPVTVLHGKGDLDYRDLLALAEAGKAHLDRIKRFDMPGFRPPSEWLREMRRYGILPAVAGPEDPIDVYAIEEEYWRSLWHRPRLED